MTPSKNVSRNNDGTDKQYDAIDDFWASFFISGLLAAVFKTLTAPFERIKLILQTQTGSTQMISAQKAAYSGFWDAMTRIPREQGFFSLWRGNFINICRYFPAQAINFSLFDVYYRAFIKIAHPETAVGHDVLSFLSGGCVGVTSSTILYPLSFCMTRISTDIGDDKTIRREFSSLHNCLHTVVKNDGFKGFYHGISYSAAGMFLYRSIYFGVYTTGKRIYLNDYSFDPTSHTINAPFPVSLVLAQLASVTSTFVTYPLDTIARQAMLLSRSGPKRLVSTRQASRIIRVEGPIGLYKGVLPNLLTTFCGSFILVSYDVFKGYYQKSQKKRESSKPSKPRQRKKPTPF